MENKKKEFKLPEIVVVELDNEQIITTSVTNFGNYNLEGEEIINF